jgi:hypothetical protein
LEHTHNTSGTSRTPHKEAFHRHSRTGKSLTGGIAGNTCILFRLVCLGLIPKEKLEVLLFDFVSLA